MASAYLKQVLKDLESKSDTKKSIKHALKDCLKQVKCRIKEEKIKVNKTKRFKKKEIIESPDKPVIKFNQKEYMAGFKDKQEQNKAFAIKLMKEQMERKSRLEQKEEEMRQQLLEEERQKEIEEYNKIREKERAKEEQIREMLEKTRQRKYHLKRLKDISERDFRKVISNTPLYKKIESEFINNFEIPELEKRKEELRKKHELFRPLDYQELQERSRYLELLQTQQKPKSIFNERSKSTKSKFLKRILDEDKEKSIAEEEKVIIKKDMKDKMWKYSQIVKEIFPPSVDMLKRKEMELIKAKLNNPTLYLKKESSIDRTISFSPRKFKKNSMVKEKNEKKQITVKDYLAEFKGRRKRSVGDLNLQNFSSDDFEVMSTQTNRKALEKMVEKYDKEARLGEMKFEHMSPFKPKAIKYSEQVDNLLVNSIKTKIAILEKQE